jgi:Bleomycin resistance protein-like N-terminal
MSPTNTNGKICYVELPTTDIARSSAFYQSVFGWSVRRRQNGSVAFDDSTGGSSVARLQPLQAFFSTSWLIALKRAWPLWSNMAVRSCRKSEWTRRKLQRGFAIRAGISSACIRNRPRAKQLRTAKSLCRSRGSSQKCCLRATNAQILKAQRLHARTIEQVLGINHDRPADDALDAVEIQ